MAKRPVGHPRTVNKDLSPGLTRSGNPPRVRISGAAAGVGKRDDYYYRAEAEKKLGRKLPENVVLDHANESLASKRSPKAKVRPESRKANSDQGGGIRHKKGGK